MERVASVLANYYATNDNLIIYLITLTKEKAFYKLHPKVKYRQPSFNVSNISFLSASIKSILYLRNLYRRLNPDAVLSFGDRYNSLALVAGLGLNVKTYVSNRMAPSLSNGWAIDLVNKIFYPFANGIIAQTAYARQVYQSRYRHKNISIISNPFVLPNSFGKHREQLIINVGRFGDKKNQHYLVNYFDEIKTIDWRLLFFGEGPKMKQTIEAVKNIEKSSKVELKGVVDNLSNYYQKAAIFAFTSISEGFPNALGEAMAAGCACISFDCEAGPSELIDDGINGFLIPVGDHELYKKKLALLLSDESLREEFGTKAIEKMKNFGIEKIAKQYLDFIMA